VLESADIQAIDADGWTEAFLEANRADLDRLALRPEVRSARRGVRLALYPSGRIGAVPLRSPVTRKVVAGVLVRPRFEWASLGAVFRDVGFRVEPELGGASLVPGSAREVPRWLLAGPVLARIDALIRRMTRRFTPVQEERSAPRGRVDWADYGRRRTPRGEWHHFTCAYSDLADDPWLQSVLRWTLGRLRTDLEGEADTLTARILLERAAILLRALGPGAELRPNTRELHRVGAGDLLGKYLAGALEAVGWVIDERGLGGDRVLDGLPWALGTEALWEAWLEDLANDLAGRIGARLSSAREGTTHRPLVWGGGVRSLGHLAPDIGLRWADRTVWIDAKYKAHFLELQRVGWSGVADKIRESHRADLHQALAYGLLADTPLVETVLAYPLNDPAADPEIASAVLPAGNRIVRMMLVGLPFGFRSPAQRERALQVWEGALRAESPAA
jgi:hypothetical protein